MLTTLPFQLLPLLPLGYFLLGDLFPGHTAQLMGVQLVQPGQQVLHPLVAHGAHGAHVDLGGHHHVVEDDPLQQGLLVVELKNSKVFSQLGWFSEPHLLQNVRGLSGRGVLA